MNSRIETKDGDTLSPMGRKEIALSERKILLTQAHAALLREERNRTRRFPVDRDDECEDKAMPPWWLALIPLAAFSLLLGSLLLGIIFSAAWWLK